MALKVRRLNAVAAAGQEQSASFFGFCILCILWSPIFYFLVWSAGADAVQATAKVVHEY